MAVGAIRNEKLKEVSVNYKALTFLFIAAAFVALGSVSQGAELFTGLRADIPFEFTAGGQILPAGIYTVRRGDNGGNALMLSSADGRGGVYFLTNATSSNMVREKASLVFNRYGDQYFLSEVWRVGDITGRQLIPSSRERELSLAMNQDKPELIVIAAAE
jgi:hypothetical protein